MAAAVSVVTLREPSNDAERGGSQMRPVMLATDGSPTAEKATATAIELADKLDTELVIASVWDLAYPAYGPMGFAPAPVNGEVAKLCEEAAGKVIAEAVSRAEEAGVETRSLVLRGFPAQAICEAAAKIRPQFLVLGSHGWGTVKRALFGSVSFGVLHRAACPVLVVPGEKTESATRRNGSREELKSVN
jgi:nucleotide-binding universal stress UspA family protein